MLSLEQHDRLDAARGISAIAVLLDHAYVILMGRLYGPTSTSVLIASIVGMHAVIIFFLLSGHLITRSIMINFQRNDRFRPREYLLARLTRVYPPLIGSVLLCALIALLIRSADLPGGTRAFGLPSDVLVTRQFFTVTASDVVAALTLQQGGMLEANGPLWTLYIEVQLYVLALVLAISWKGDRLTRTCMTVLGAIILSLLSTQIAMATVWTIGAATALFARHRKAWLCVGALSAITVFILEVRHTRLDGYLKEAVLTPTNVLFGVVYCVLLFFSKPRWRVPRAVAATASFSYSLYIIHFPLLLLVLAVTQDWAGASELRSAIVTVFACLLTIAAAKFFSSWFEDQAFFKRLLVQPLPQLGKGSA